MVALVTAWLVESLDLDAADAASGDFGMRGEVSVGSSLSAGDLNRDMALWVTEIYLAGRSKCSR